MQTTRITLTNLVTNPSFEVDTSGWNGHVSAMSRTTADAKFGSASMQTTFSGTGSAVYYTTNFTVSGLYFAGAWVKAPAGNRIFIQFYYDGTSTNNNYAEYSTTGDWQFIYNQIAPALGPTGTLEIGSGNGAFTANIDGVIMTQGPSYVDYFDGSFGTGYSWSGTPNESVSYYRQFQAAAVAPVRHVNTGVLISWDKGTASNVDYFTIGTSTIGGSDIIKSGGGTPAFADQYNYKDYTSYVTSWQTSIQQGQFPYGMISRQADITLRNTDNSFTPASGTSLGPNVKTGRPVKISVGFNNETIGQFVGYSDSPVSDSTSRTTSLHCYDSIDYLNSYISQTTPTQTNQRADQIIQTLLEEAGFSSSQFSLEISLQKAIAILAPQGQTIGSIIQKLCEAEGALFFSDENGILHFWNRQHFANQTTPVATFTYSNTAAFQQQDAPILNAVEVKATPLTYGTDAKIWEYSTPIYLPAIGPNSSNLIANPSFEYTTSGWTGTFSRASTGYIGSYSLSGTNMTYDISSAMQQLSNGGYRATIQCFVKAPAGQAYTVKFNGSPISGQSITGSSSKGLTGNGDWQNITLDASNYTLSISPGLGAWVPAGSVPSSSYASPMVNGYVTYSGYVYMMPAHDSTIAYAALNQGSVGQFYTTNSPPDYYQEKSMAAGGGFIAARYGKNEVSCAKINSDGSLQAFGASTNFQATYRYDDSLVIYNGYIYSLGGDDGAGNDIATVEYAKINSDGTVAAFAYTTAMPGSRALFGAYAYNGYMYITGGQSGSDVNHTYYAKINSDGTLGAWVQTNDPGVDDLSDGTTLTYAGGYLYLMTTTNSQSTAVIAYAVINADGSLGTWSQTTPSPSVRIEGALIASNGYLYAIGGYDSTGALQTSIISNALATGGVSFSVTATNAVLLDCVSSDITNSYYDGDTADTELTTYSWTGTAGNSVSRAVSTPQPVSVQASFSNPVLSIDFPTATTSGINSSYYITNGNSDGSGASLGSFVQVSSVQINGTSATIVFANTGTTQGYLTDIVLWGRAAVPGQVIVQTSIDNTSITQYKLNPANGGQIMSIDNNNIQDASSAAGLAFYLVNGYSNPKAKYASDVFALPQLQFGDLVSFYNQETGQTDDLFVTGITTKYGTGGAFQQTLTLEKKVLSTYFAIGTSAIGGTDQIAP